MNECQMFGALVRLFMQVETNKIKHDCAAEVMIDTTWLVRLLCDHLGGAAFVTDDDRCLFVESNCGNWDMLGWRNTFKGSEPPHATLMG